MSLRFVMPPSVGAARARARGELLGDALASELGERVIVQVAPDYAALERAVVDGSAELVWAPAAVCAVVEGSARALFKVVRGGRASYRAALVARRDARLTLQRLAGKRAAWVDRRSLGGYLLVARHLRELGIDPARTFASQVFLGTHPAALAEVLEGRADVAAVSISGSSEEHVENALELHAGRAGSRDLSALAITNAAPTDALVLTRSLDPATHDALVARLSPVDATAGRVSSLCLAMEAEGFERAREGEYAPILALLDDDG